jgi:hypothetical protein
VKNGKVRLSLSKTRENQQILANGKILINNVQSKITIPKKVKKSKLHSSFFVCLSGSSNDGKKQRLSGSSKWWKKKEAVKGEPALSYRQKFIRKL